MSCYKPSKNLLKFDILFNHRKMQTEQNQNAMYIYI